MHKPTCFITANGIRTIVYTDAGLPYQSLSVCLDMTQATHDFCHPHFLEHVLIRDQAQYDGQSLSQLVAATANQVDASTYPEVVEFTLDCVPNATSDLFPKLLDTLAHPALSQTAIDKERTVIRSEMRERASSPYVGIWERVLHNYGVTHTAQQEADSLDQVTVDSLRTFYKRMVVTSNIFVISSGPMTHDTIRRMLETSALTDQPTMSKGIGTIDFGTPSTRIVSRSESQSTTHFMEVFNYQPSIASSIVLSRISNAERSDSFWHKAIDDIGIYSASFSNVTYPYYHNAHFCLQTEGDDDKVKAVHELCRRELQSILTSDSLDDRIKLAKLSIHNDGIMFHKYSPSYFRNELFDQLPSFPDILSDSTVDAQIDLITSADIQNLAEALLTAPTSYSLVGSDQSIESMSKYLS